MNKRLNLEQVAPQPVGVSVYVDDSSDEMIDIVLRPLNLDDQVWMRERYTEEGLQKVFSEVNAAEILAIIYHQLDQESRKKLPRVEIEEIDDEGEVRKRVLSGPQLLRRGVRGAGHLLLLLEALIKSMGVSVPEIDSTEVGADKGKKSKPTGGKSST